MKYLTMILALVAAVASCGPKDGWKLVWTEDFDGPEIDGAVWSRVPQGQADWNDMMSLRPDLAYIEDGALVLLGKNNDGSSTDSTPFVTGGVSSKGKKSFALARFEVKARFNCVSGFWPALWLMPDDKSPWPLGGELDIMEHLNADSLVYQTVHSAYTLRVDTESSHGSTAPVDPGAWNIYATEIYRDSICMYTNGVKTLTYPRMDGMEHQFPWSDRPYYFILSNQLGGGWVGPVAPEQLPSELRIDWVKVYQRREE